MGITQIIVKIAFIKHFLARISCEFLGFPANSYPPTAQARQSLVRNALAGR